jgi:bifunctional UDP-N-acetylglucosamine pyrophosphorylase/glucosamine-1-phosphate N-acetyltransferase
MKSRRPKVMHPLAGRPMIGHLLATVDAMAPDEVVVVIGEDMDEVADAVHPHKTAVQHERLGTAHAVRAAMGALDGFDGDVVVLYGDTPLITRETVTAMLGARRGEGDPAVVVLGFRPDDPGAYGRLIAGADGALERIVEAKDANDDELAVDLCNSGVMAFDGKVLAGLLARIGNDNAKGEYYLTDAVELARADGRACRVIEGDAEELLGINSRGELAVAEALVQSDLRAAALEGGATLIDPSTVYFSFDTALGTDVTVGPNVVFGPGVSVGDGADIKAFCHIEGATIGAGVSVGPFARLRPEAVVADGARIGNFVEIKKATVEPGAKVNHLSYIGDARVGANANIGAGTITCNYDGFFKSFTDIGAGAFIGSNTALVAPVKIGDGAVVGAGSTITHDVAADALSLTRAQQVDRDGMAKTIREHKAAKKAEQQKKKGG